MTYFDIYCKLFDYLKSLGFPYWETDFGEQIDAFIIKHYLFINDKFVSHIK